MTIIHISQNILMCICQVMRYALEGVGEICRKWQYTRRMNTQVIEFEQQRMVYKDSRCQGKRKSDTSDGNKYYFGRDFPKQPPNQQPEMLRQTSHLLKMRSPCDKVVQQEVQQVIHGWYNKTSQDLVMHGVKIQLKLNKCKD